MDCLDARMMARALKLARQGRFTTRPNPNVGCVIAQGEYIVGEGWHQQAGLAHAEVNALSDAGDKAKGATAYVTLEPCNHQGRTGPCSEALIEAGVARVVYGMEDPNPLVAGNGLARLANAGVEVVGPLLEEQAYRLNRGFVKRMREGLPWVSSKVAISLDGRTAMASGESQWITGSAARADVQKLRAQSCAIVTGIGSIDADDSRLTVRVELDQLIEVATEISIKQPLRVVVDSQLAIPPDAQIFQEDGDILLATTPAAIDKRGNELQARFSEKVSIEAFGPTDNGQVDLDALLRYLASEEQCNQVFIEAGSRLNGALLSQELIDEYVVYQAPILLGAQARPMADWIIEAMADKQQLQVTDRRQIGADQRITATVLRKAPILA